MSEPTPPRRVTLGLVLLLGSMTALGPLTIDTYLPALPEMARALAASEAQIQLTLTTMLIGLGLGQLVCGPLSDTVGRRLPLLIGFSGHIAVSLAIALAPSAEVVVGLRLLQGLFGSAIMVVAMAVVRDLFSGSAVVLMLSRLALVIGLAPILAPSLGGLLLTLTSWRGIFVALAVIGATVMLVVLRRLPETLGPERRIAPGLRSTARSYRTVLAERRYVVMVVVAAANSVSLFGYVSGSSFIFQDGFGLSPQQFALVFGMNGVLLIGGTQLTPLLVGRLGAERVLLAALVASLLGSVLVTVVGLTGAGLVPTVISLALVLGMLGFCLPTTTSLALEHHARNAGTATAMLGAGRFAIAGAAAPLVGLLADGTSAGLGTVMVGANLIAVLAMVWVIRQPRPAAGI